MISCLVSSEGEEWQSIRSLLGKHMLRPKAVEAYDHTLNSVVDDLITKLRLRRSSQGLVADIAGEFYRFGLEGEEGLPTRTAAVLLHGFMERPHGFFRISSCFVWRKTTLNRGYCLSVNSDSFIHSLHVSLLSRWH